MGLPRGKALKFIPPVQRQRAAAMRSAPTVAERLLWNHLRGSGLDGVKFSRQVAIGPFIADFVARSRMLVVELDGQEHGAAQDRWRQGLIEARGYTVVRFGNEEVYGNVDGVLLTILEALKSCPSGPGVVCAEVPPPAPPVPGGEQIGALAGSLPPPGPLPSGEGEQVG